MEPNFRMFNWVWQLLSLFRLKSSMFDKHWNPAYRICSGCLIQCLETKMCSARNTKRHYFLLILNWSHTTTWKIHQRAIEEFYNGKRPTPLWRWMGALQCVIPEIWQKFPSSKILSIWQSSENNPERLFCRNGFECGRVINNLSTEWMSKVLLYVDIMYIPCFQITQSTTH